MSGKQRALDKAANEAIFIEHLMYEKAIKFVMSRVRGVKREEVTQALDTTMVWYKS